MRDLRSLVTKLVVFSAVVFSLLVVQGLLGGGVVNSCTQTELESALAGGGTVTFACDGTITLTNTITICLDTLLNASGHAVTISGNQAVRVFTVNPGVNFALVNLTIANGFWASTNSNCGGGIFNNGGAFTATLCTFVSNQVGTISVNAPAFGGALCNSNGNSTLARCSFLYNVASGGRGTVSFEPGKAGKGGAINNSGMLVLAGCAFAGNLAAGGLGAVVLPHWWEIGTGGPGLGGAVFNTGTLLMTNTTLAMNDAFGGVGLDVQDASGQAGPGHGGAIYSDGGSATLVYSTIASNRAVAPSPSYPGVLCLGAGVFATNGSLTMGNSIVANNLVSPDYVGMISNCFGSVVDGGHNISSDGSCPFSAPGSMTNTDAMLGPLGNYGGATRAFPLLKGSPAINAGDQNSSPATDQRGFPRPIGLAPEIGAFEYGSPAFLEITRSDGGGFDILVTGKGGQTCRLLASQTLLSWQSIGTNQFSGNGTALFHEEGSSAKRFFQAFLP